MIFNGIEVMFFLLGIFTAIGAFIMIYYSRKYIFKWYTWVLRIFAGFMVLFTIAWSWSSILEEEPQASAMGLLIFGIPALILIFITRKMILKSEDKQIS